MLSSNKFYTDNDFKDLTSESLSNYEIGSDMIKFSDFSTTPLVQEILTPEELKSEFELTDLLREIEGLY